jgi:ribosomal protein L39E
MSVCKLLPKTATKEEKRIAHYVRMQTKKNVREHNYNRDFKTHYIPANLSRNHPDYGMNMADHLAEKEKRS